MSLNSPSEYEDYLWTLEGKAVEVVVRPPKVQRSQKQSRYYYGVIVPLMAEYCGYSKDEMHEAIAWRLLQVGDGDEKLPRRRSTADLTVQEFEAFTEAARKFAAEEFGLDIPAPNEVDLG